MSCLHISATVQRQTAVAAHFSSKHLLLFTFVRQSTPADFLGFLPQFCAGTAGAIVSLNIAYEHGGEMLATCRQLNVCDFFLSNSGVMKCQVEYEFPGFYKVTKQHFPPMRIFLHRPDVWRVEEAVAHNLTLFRNQSGCSR